MGWRITDGIVEVSSEALAVRWRRDASVRARLAVTPHGVRIDGDDVDAAARGLRLWLHRRALDGTRGTVRVQAADGVLAQAGVGPDGFVEVPAVERSDGVVRVRALHEDDLDADLAAKDDAQIRWMWTGEEVACWRSMSADAQRSHALEGLRARRHAFGSGPKWCFAADADAPYVAYVDVDLASPNAPAGEANIAYSAHPAHRGRGYVARTVRLALEFLALHTACPRAHILVDADNVPSLRVARSVCQTTPTAASEDRVRFSIDVARIRCRP